MHPTSLHSLTRHPDRLLHAALILSLTLHAAPLLMPPYPPARPPETPPAALQVQLAPPAPPISPPPELRLDDTPPATNAPPPAAEPRKKSLHTAVDRKKTAKTPEWTQQIGRQFARQQQEGLFYPAEAIRQGLEGEALVLLLLGPDGAVAAARIEASSGHRLLDDAALRAVRRLHTLPADMPQEVLLPVRFRLR